MISTTPPSGFRDYLPQTCALRVRALETISKTYRSFGFSPIETPSVESLEVLTGKGGGENEKLIFKILKRGEKLELSLGTSELADMGLRFDLTLPLARYYAKNQGKLPHPFKAYHIGPVWRAERAQKGRYREFMQCDVDIVGSASLQCESEVIAAVLSAFDALSVSPLLHLNDRNLLTALCDAAKVPGDKRAEALILLDKIDKVGAPAVLAEMEALLGRDCARFFADHVLREKPDLDRLKALAPEAMDRLEAVITSLTPQFGKDRLILSPSLVRGLDYYTGTVFEFRHPQMPISLGGGGRYDRLTEQFGLASVPACGASIGFERLMLLLEESDHGRTDAAPRACMTVFSPELYPAALEAAAALRKQGLDIDVYPGAGKLKAQFKYADSKRSRYALVIGPEEAAVGRIKAKDLLSGQETLETRETLAALLKNSGA